MAEQVLRFSVKSRDGKSRSNSWRCWVPSESKDDVYLVCRELGQAIKVSFHESGQWHIGFEQLFLDRNAPPDSYLLEDRFVGKWEEPQELPPAGSGCWLMFRLIILETALTTPIAPGYSLKDGNWIGAPNKGKAREVAIIATGPNTKVSSWPGAKGMGTELVGSIPVKSNGRTIWVVQQEVDMPMPNLGGGQGKTTYFGEANKESLKQDGLKALLFGSDDLGRKLIEVPVMPLASDDS